MTIKKIPDRGGKFSTNANRIFQLCSRTGLSHLFTITVVCAANISVAVLSKIWFVPKRVFLFSQSSFGKKKSMVIAHSIINESWVEKKQYKKETTTKVACQIYNILLSK